MEIVIVERDLPVPATPADVMQSRAESAGCFALRDVRHIKSFLSADGVRLICVFEAPDAASVRDAIEHSGGTFGRAWRAYVVPDVAP